MKGKKPKSGNSKRRSRGPKAAPQEQTSYAESTFTFAGGAFTFWAFLVTIVVVAVLAALLLPALGR